MASIFKGGFFANLRGGLNADSTANSNTNVRGSTSAIGASAASNSTTTAAAAGGSAANVAMFGPTVSLILDEAVKRRNSKLKELVVEVQMSNFLEIETLLDVYCNASEQLVGQVSVTAHEIPVPLAGGDGGFAESSAAVGSSSSSSSPMDEGRRPPHHFQTLLFAHLTPPSAGISTALSAKLLQMIVMDIGKLCARNIMPLSKIDSAIQIVWKSFVLSEWGNAATNNTNATAMAAAAVAANAAANNNTATVGTTNNGSSSSVGGGSSSADALLAAALQQGGGSGHGYEEMQQRMVQASIGLLNVVPVGSSQLQSALSLVFQIALQARSTVVVAAASAAITQTSQTVLRSLLSEDGGATASAAMPSPMRPSLSSASAADTLKSPEPKLPGNVDGDLKEGDVDSDPVLGEGIRSPPTTSSSIFHRGALSQPSVTGKHLNAVLFFKDMCTMINNGGGGRKGGGEGAQAASRPRWVKLVNPITTIESAPSLQLQLLLIDALTDVFAEAAKMQSSINAGQQQATADPQAGASYSTLSAALQHAREGNNSGHAPNFVDSRAVKSVPPLFAQCLNEDFVALVLNNDPTTPLPIASAASFSSSHSATTSSVEKFTRIQQLAVSTVCRFHMHMHHTVTAILNKHCMVIEECLSDVESPKWPMSVVIRAWTKALGDFNVVHSLLNLSREKLVGKIGIGATSSSAIPGTGDDGFHHRRFVSSLNDLTADGMSSPPPPPPLPSDHTSALLADSDTCATLFQPRGGQAAPAAVDIGRSQRQHFASAAEGCSASLWDGARPSSLSAVDAAEEAMVAEEARQCGADLVVAENQRSDIRLHSPLVALIITVARVLETDTRGQVNTDVAFDFIGVIAQSISRLCETTCASNGNQWPEDYCADNDANPTPANPDASLLRRVLALLSVPIHRCVQHGLQEVLVKWRVRQVTKVRSLRTRALNYLASSGNGSGSGGGGSGNNGANGDESLRSLLYTSSAAAAGGVNADSISGGGIESAAEMETMETLHGLIKCATHMVKATCVANLPRHRHMYLQLLTTLITDESPAWLSTSSVSLTQQLVEESGGSAVSSAAVATTNTSSSSVMPASDNVSPTIGGGIAHSIAISLHPSHNAHNAAQPSAPLTLNANGTSSPSSAAAAAAAAVTTLHQPPRYCNTPFVLLVQLFNAITQLAGGMGHRLKASWPLVCRVFLHASLCRTYVNAEADRVDAANLPHLLTALCGNANHAHGTTAAVTGGATTAGAGSGIQNIAHATNDKGSPTGPVVLVNSAMASQHSAAYQLVASHAFNPSLLADTSNVVASIEEVFKGLLLSFGEKNKRNNNVKGREAATVGGGEATTANAPSDELILMTMCATFAATVLEYAADAIEIIVESHCDLPLYLQPLADVYKRTAERASLSASPGRGGGVGSYHSQYLHIAAASKASVSAPTTLPDPSRCLPLLQLRQVLEVARRCVFYVVSSPHGAALLNRPSPFASAALSNNNPQQETLLHALWTQCLMPLVLNPLCFARLEGLGHGAATNKDYDQLHQNEHSGGGGGREGDSSTTSSRHALSEPRRRPHHRIFSSNDANSENVPNFNTTAAAGGPAAASASHVDPLAASLSGSPTSPCYIQHTRTASVNFSVTNTATDGGGGSPLLTSSIRSGAVGLGFTRNTTHASFIRRGNGAGVNNNNASQNLQTPDRNTRHDFDNLVDASLPHSATSIFARCPAESAIIDSGLLAGGTDATYATLLAHYVTLLSQDASIVNAIATQLYESDRGSVGVGGGFASTSLSANSGSGGGGGDGLDNARAVQYFCTTARRLSNAEDQQSILFYLALRRHALDLVHNLYTAANLLLVPKPYVLAPRPPQNGLRCYPAATTKQAADSTTTNKDLSVTFDSVHHQHSSVTSIHGEGNSISQREDFHNSSSKAQPAFYRLRPFTPLELRMSSAIAQLSSLRSQTILKHTHRMLSGSAVDSLQQQEWVQLLQVLTDAAGGVPTNASLYPPSITEGVRDNDRDDGDDENDNDGDRTYHRSDSPAAAEGGGGEKFEERESGGGNANSVASIGQARWDYFLRERGLTHLPIKKLEHLNNKSLAVQQSNNASATVSNNTGASDFYANTYLGNVVLDTPAAFCFSHSEDALIAFRVVETVHHNAITSLRGRDALNAMIGCIGAFIVQNSHEKLSLNLSATQVMWALADYLATLVQERKNANSNSSGGGGGFFHGRVDSGAFGNTFNGGGGGGVGGNHSFSSDSNSAASGSVYTAHSSGNQRIAGLNAAEVSQLWISVVKQLLCGCLDQRCEVRQSSLKTFFSVLTTHGRSALQPAAWDVCCWHVIRCLMAASSARSREELVRTVMTLNAMGNKGIFVEDVAALVAAAGGENNRKPSIPCSTLSTPQKVQFANTNNSDNNKRSSTAAMKAAESLYAIRDVAPALCESSLGALYDQLVKDAKSHADLKISLLDSTSRVLRLFGNYLLTPIGSSHSSVSHGAQQQGGKFAQQHHPSLFNVDLRAAAAANNANNNSHNNNNSFEGQQTAQHLITPEKPSPPAASASAATTSSTSPSSSSSHRFPVTNLSGFIGHLLRFSGACIISQCGATATASTNSCIISQCGATATASTNSSLSPIPASEDVVAAACRTIMSLFGDFWARQQAMIMMMSSSAPLPPSSSPSPTTTAAASSSSSSSTFLLGSTDVGDSWNALMVAVSHPSTNAATLVAIVEGLNDVLSVAESRCSNLLMASQSATLMQQQIPAATAATTVVVSPNTQFDVVTGSGGVGRGGESRISSAVVDHSQQLPPYAAFYALLEACLRSPVVSDGYFFPSKPQTAVLSALLTRMGASVKKDESESGPLNTHAQRRGSSAPSDEEEQQQQNRLRAAAMQSPHMASHVHKTITMLLDCFPSFEQDEAAISQTLQYATVGMISNASKAPSSSSLSSPPLTFNQFKAVFKAQFPSGSHHVAFPLHLASTLIHTILPFILKDDDENGSASQTTATSGSSGAGGDFGFEDGKKVTIVVDDASDDDLEDENVRKTSSPPPPPPPRPIVCTDKLREWTAATTIRAAGGLLLTIICVTALIQKGNTGALFGFGVDAASKMGSLLKDVVEAAKANRGRRQEQLDALLLKKKNTEDGSNTLFNEEKQRAIDRVTSANKLVLACLTAMADVLSFSATQLDRTAAIAFEGKEPHEVSNGLLSPIESMLATVVEELRAALTREQNPLVATASSSPSLLLNNNNDQRNAALKKSRAATVTALTRLSHVASAALGVLRTSAAEALKAFAEDHDDHHDRQTQQEQLHPEQHKDEKAEPSRLSAELEEEEEETSDVPPPPPPSQLMQSTGAPNVSAAVRQFVVNKLHGHAVAADDDEHQHALPPEADATPAAKDDEPIMADHDQTEKQPPAEEGEEPPSTVSPADTNSAAVGAKKEVPARLLLERLAALATRYLEMTNNSNLSSSSSARGSALHPSASTTSNNAGSTTHSPADSNALSASSTPSAASSPTTTALSANKASGYDLDDVATVLVETLKAATVTLENSRNNTDDGHSGDGEESTAKSAFAMWGQPVLGLIAVSNNEIRVALQAFLSVALV